MKIKRIQLRFFRNYETVDFICHGKHLFLLGNNAQGKTNFLEAIYYLSTVRSFRTNDDIELIQFDRDFAKLILSFERENKDVELEMVISRSGKYVIYNGNNINKMSDLIGLLNAIVFSPLDMKYLFGSPKDRRKFIDMELGKISPSYLHDLLLSQKLLKERNSYLKNMRIDDVYLEVITNQLIDVQLKIIKARAMFIRLLEDNASVIYKNLTNESEFLSVVYHPCTPVTDQDVMRQDLQIQYQRSLEKDKEQRITSIGIHREDFVMSLGNLELQMYGSQGQRRSAVLSLKIGLLEVVRKRIKEYPVLLLDDVLSELDEKHRIQLFQIIPEGVQVFVTATDINQKEKNELKNSSFYQVNQGIISKEE